MKRAIDRINGTTAAITSIKAKMAESQANRCTEGREITA